jgi:hypothetical protein
MKLLIKPIDGLNIKLWLPTSLLKSKFIIKRIIKHCGDDNEQLMNSLPIINKSIKEYIRKNGHFVLIEIQSFDGDLVQIKV